MGALLLIGCSAALLALPEQPSVQHGQVQIDASQADVGSFTASTLQRTNENLLAGQYVLRQSPDHSLAAVVNQGTIRAEEGGFIVLMSPLVENSGPIVGRSGQL